MNEYIEIKRARIHNLKDIDIKIPKNKLTVITGVSGSGKSSLAFDTLYEEGKRRYLMFSGTQLLVDSVPVFDQITGLSPTVAVEQRIIRQSNPRSTVGTRTKISSLLAALYANFGELDSRDGKSGQSARDKRPLTMEMFQKNSPKGMCVKCLGHGIVKKLEEEKLFADRKKLIEEICLGVGKRGSTRKQLDAFYKYYGLTPKQSLESLTEEQLMVLQYGDTGRSSFIGFIPWIHQIINGAFSSSGRLEYLLTKEGLMKRIACPKCNGTGRSPQAAHATIGGKTIDQLEELYIKDLNEFLSQLTLKRTPLLDEIRSKLTCMADVGLHHLSLSRQVPTLSGGEIQRLFLASYIIAEMDSIVFVFDEPTIGLHEVEKERLIHIIRQLVCKGNTVVCVEHDVNFMKTADYIIDLGPNAGIYGGERIFQGSYEAFLSCQNSNTAPYLLKQNLVIKKDYKPIQADKTLKIANANLHNLKNVRVELPLGLMLGVAGVSGSGKSSLISDTLVKKLTELLKIKVKNGDSALDLEDAIDPDDRVEVGISDGFLDTVTELSFETEAEKTSLSGHDQLQKCLVIDQRPIGRSRASCPATYTGIYDRIRSLFAKESGLPIGFFSVNSKGGCKRCKGYGIMHYHVGFGNYIELDCEACAGTGFVQEAMEVRLDGKGIKDVLQMTVDEALGFFADKDKLIRDTLQTLQRVGMGYITLGQKTPTISGGESQRIKLAKELSRGQRNKNALYILDEPTTGLSFHDTLRLVKLMQELVDKGNSVIITEHDPYVLSNCDYIIEMGVGGGREGGSVIAEGSPTALKGNKNSIIGRYLL